MANHRRLRRDAPGVAAVQRLPAFWITLAVVLLSTVLVTKSHVSHAGNESSRLATVYCLVEQGTFCIDRSPFETVDKVRIGGRFYSDKPPLFVLWLAAGARTARAVAGLTFDRTRPALIALLNFLGGGLFAVVLAAFLFARCWRAGLKPRVSGVLAATAILGTWVFSYSATLNNHVPAACLLWIAFVTLERALLVDGVSRYFLAGVILGLVLNVDIPHGVFFSLAALGTVLRHAPTNRWKNAGALAGGVGLLGLVFLLLNTLAHGSWLPAYLVAGAYGYPGDIHAAVYAGQPDLAHYLSYAWQVLVGSRGLFSYMPVLLLATPTLLARSSPSPMPVPSRQFVLTGTLLSLLYHVGRTNDLGGWAYGFRFFIPLIPLLFWAAVLSVKSSGRRAGRRLFAALAAAGIMTSAIGAYSPWPVCDESAVTSVDAVEKNLRNTFVINLSAMLYEHASTRPVGEAILRGYAGDRAWPLLTATYLNQDKDLLARMAAGRMRRR